MIAPSATTAKPGQERTRTDPVSTGVTPVPPLLSRALGKLLLSGVLGTALALLLLALAGVFTPKVPSSFSLSLNPSSLAGGMNRDVSDRAIVEVHRVRRPRHETAVGTVKAVHETAVASKLLARVTEVSVKAGQPVTRDQVLVRLDDSDLQARLRQAEAAISAAKAFRGKAGTEYDRANRLRASQAISQEEFERATTALKTATADLERAQQVGREAKVLLDFATVRAPMGGIVIDKRVEEGDTVTPGKVLLTLFDPSRMQMVVTVRESLARRLSVGQKIPGRLEALNHDCQATIAEIVPEAQVASRSFTVKVTGPCPPGVYTGMFGRIFIPLEDEEIVVVPASAVFRVGQLQMVEVIDAGRVLRRSVQLGRRLEDNYEVLAGLRPGESVLVRSRPTDKGARS